ncbi:MAG: protease modulator HflC [Clostridia bacterium]
MKKTLIITGIILALIALLLFNGMFFVVAEDEHVCVVRFSKIVETKSEAGIYFKLPFVDECKFYPKSAQLYDIKPSTVILKDKTAMIVDSYVMWKISDPQIFYQKVTSTADAQNRLDNIAYNNIMAKFGMLNQEDVVNIDPPSERNDIYDEILSLVQDGAKLYGIEVTDVKIKRFDLPEYNEKEVYNRMISERNQIAEQYRAQGELNAARITNDVDKKYNTKISNAEVEAEHLIAEGEAEYMRILSESYSTEERLTFYKFVRALDALEKSLVGGNKTIILGADSEIAKIILALD